MSGQDETQALGDSGSGPRRPARIRWQVGLRTTIYLVAAVAMGMSIVADRRRIAILAPRIASLKPEVRELEVIDPARTAVVEMEDLWMAGRRWEVYLPKGTKYRLCIATRGVDGPKIVASSQTIPLAEGRQVVGLKEEEIGKTWRLTATADSGRMTMTETSDWKLDGASSGGGAAAVSSQSPPERPIILTYRTYQNRSDSGTYVKPDGPSNGLILWVEPEPSLAK